MADKEHIIRMNGLVRIPRTRYANKALLAIKVFARKHTHAAMDDIRVSSDVNHTIWKQGKQKKVGKFSVVLKKKDNTVWVFTPEGNDLKAFEKQGAPAKKEAKVKAASTTEAVVKETMSTSEKAPKSKGTATEKAKKKETGSEAPAHSPKAK